MYFLSSFARACEVYLGSTYVGTCIYYLVPNKGIGPEAEWAPPHTFRIGPEVNCPPPPPPPTFRISDWPPTFRIGPEANCPTFRISDLKWTAPPSPHFSYIGPEVDCPPPPPPPLFVWGLTLSTPLAEILDTPLASP